MFVDLLDVKGQQWLINMDHVVSIREVESKIPPATDEPAVKRSCVFTMSNGESCQFSCSCLGLTAVMGDEVMTPLVEE